MISRYYAALLPVYTLFLLYMMLFGCGRIAGEIGNLQIVPFRSITYFSTEHVGFWKFFLNIVCNVVVFVPFGYMGWVFSPLKSFSLLLPIFVLGIVFIELIQYFTGLGTADIDDVILNTVGMSSGYICFRIKNSATSESLQTEV